MSATDLLEDDILDLILNGNAAANFTFNGSWFVGLLTVLPDDDGAGQTEVTGGAYARVAFDGGASDKWTLDGLGTASNNAIITFPTATAAWGVVVGWALFDLSGAGDMGIYGEFPGSFDIVAGQTASFAIGALVVTCD